MGKRKFEGIIVGQTDQFPVSFQIVVQAVDEEEARRLIQKEIEGAVNQYRRLLGAHCVDFSLERIWEF